MTLVRRRKRLPVKMGPPRRTIRIPFTDGALRQLAELLRVLDLTSVPEAYADERARAVAFEIIRQYTALVWSGNRRLEKMSQSLQYLPPGGLYIVLEVCRTAFGQDEVIFTLPHFIRPEPRFPLRAITARES